MAAARFYSSTAGSLDLTIAVGPSDTAISVSSTAGLPGVVPFTLVLDPGQASEEIVTVTNISGFTLTVIRGVDGSAATSHSAGIGNIRHMATARDFREPQEHIGAKSAVHGITGSVVGTSDAQSLTNKNLTSGTNTFPASLATTSAFTSHTGASTAHGATGAVVGTTNTQTLTNKTLADPNFTGTVNSAGNVVFGDAGSTSQPGAQWFRKATTGANTYNGLAYLTDNGTTSRLGLVMKQNGAEVNRFELLPDGTAMVKGVSIMPGSDRLTGTVVLSGDATNQRFVDITFSPAFPSAPIVLLQGLTGQSSSSTTWSVWPSAVTATGCRINGVRNNTTDMSVRWVALQA